MTILDNASETEFGTFVSQVGVFFEGKMKRNSEDDENYVTPEFIKKRASCGGARFRRSKEIATEASSAELKQALDQWTRADFTQFEKFNLNEEKLSSNRKS